MPPKFFNLFCLILDPLVRCLESRGSGSLGTHAQSSARRVRLSRCFLLPLRENQLSVRSLRLLGNIYTAVMNSLDFLFHCCSLLQIRQKPTLHTEQLATLSLSLYGWGSSRCKSNFLNVCMCLLTQLLRCLIGKDHQIQSSCFVRVFSHRYSKTAGFKTRFLQASLQPSVGD